MSRAFFSRRSRLDEMDSSCDLRGINVPKSLHLMHEEEPIMDNHTRIAVDVAKAVFEIVVSQQPGKVHERARVPRHKFLAFFVQRPAATVVVEACGSAHHWGRQLQRLGHQVVLLPAHQVRPYVLRNKTDRTDAKGLLEAFHNDDSHRVPVKSVEQQTLHRLRSAWLAERTAKINTLRGRLRELGFVIPGGAHHVVPRAWGLIEDADSGLPEVLREPFAEVCRELRTLEERIKDIEHQLAALAEQLPVVERLRSIPGVGLLTATAVVALTADIHRSRLAATSPAISASPRANAPAAPSAAWAPSPNAAPCTCACCSSTAPALRCGTPSASRNRIACAPGRCAWSGASATTRRPWRWPTNWPASSGPCGNTIAASSLRPRRRDQLPNSSLPHAAPRIE